MDKFHPQLSAGVIQSGNIQSDVPRPFDCTMQPEARDMGAIRKGGSHYFFTSPFICQQERDALRMGLTYGYPFVILNSCHD